MRRGLVHVKIYLPIKKRLRVRVGITRKRHLTLHPTLEGHSVTHLTTYGGPLVKGISMHAMLFVY